MKALFTFFISVLFASTAFAQSAADYFSQGLYEHDKGNFEKAAELYDKACLGGYAMGCFSLGYMYVIGEGVKQDYVKTVELLEKACVGGYAEGCYDLGVMYANGKGVKIDENKAFELFGKACDMNEQLGCENYEDLKKQLGK